MKEQDNDGKDEHECAEKAWADHCKRNQSMITQLFYGQQKSTLRCMTCQKKSVTFDTFNHLSLPLPVNKNRCDVYDCLELYLQAEKVPWKCPNCGCVRDSVKKFDLWRLPPIIILHLKRFQDDGILRRKLPTYVDFQFANMNFEDYLEGQSKQKTTNYDLYGVSNHMGTLDGGHYTAYCKNSALGRWFRYDDQEVYEIEDQTSVRSNAAYILFYSLNDYMKKQFSPWS